MAQLEAKMEPAVHRSLRQDNPWLHNLVQTAALDIPPGPYEEADRDAVLELGFRYVVLRRDGWFSTDRDLGEGQLKRTEERLIDLIGPPVYRDARLWIWAPIDGELPCDPASITPDLEPVINDPSLY
jgi:hypothetical protein